MRRPSLLSDFAQVASGAASAFGDVKGELDMIIQSQIEKILANRGLVTREDFDAAQARIAALADRIAELESQQKAPKTKKQAGPASKNAPKPKK